MTPSPHHPVLDEGEGRASADLEGDKPLPAPGQNLEGKWIFQERV